MVHAGRSVVSNEAESRPHTFAAKLDVPTGDPNELKFEGPSSTVRTEDVEAKLGASALVLFPPARPRPATGPPQKSGFLVLLKSPISIVFAGRI
jgi:hypothetical protein